MDHLDSDEEISSASRTLGYLHGASLEAGIPPALSAYYLRQCEKIGYRSSHRLENHSFSGFRVCPACKISWKEVEGIPSCRVAPPPAAKKSRKFGKGKRTESYPCRAQFFYGEKSRRGSNALIYKCRNCSRASSVRLLKPERSGDSVLFIDKLPDTSQAVPTPSPRLNHSISNPGKKAWHGGGKRVATPSVSSTLRNKKQQKTARIRGMLSASANEKSAKPSLSLKDFLF